ncbi:mRNA (2'-O-methyladenosine-N(6)-)-methyltransferase [Malassezia caprae]|uniref:mRNA m(6)A methyltransferase n=1 Tax=Malassezia caprae TaxID=1381934 RepID=A0AAF0IV96_9BASI|nr:mRNA (2'-O-methyladenosine-N(6)-)-methyltransferase [Malassezia caprae]
MHYVVDDTPPQAPFVWACTSLTPYPMQSQYAREASLREPMQQLSRYGLGAWMRPGPEGVPDDQLRPGQWINCDLRTFDLSRLGHFDVILADPPWDIHMSLPYGTLSDDDMRALDVPALQGEGLLFLWVTGRSMELGRQLLSQWGYTRADELIWIKTNQMERLVRTGRTGHWLNHSKEHCLVGIKHAKRCDQPDAWAPGQIRSVLPWLHDGLGTDVIVAQVRDTSRKPDELYAMIEKMCPGGRKVELFGRRHNVRPGWLTLGNQLKSTYVVEPRLRTACAAAPAGPAEALQMPART